MPGPLGDHAGSGEQDATSWPTNIMSVPSPDSLQQITSKLMTTAREMARTAGVLLFQVQGRACLVTRHRGALCLRGLTASACKERGEASQKQANHAVCEISAMRRGHCQLEDLMTRGLCIRKTDSSSAVLLCVRGTGGVRRELGRGSCWRDWPGQMHAGRMAPSPGRKAAA